MPKKHRPHLDNLVDTSAHRLSFWHSVVCPSDSAHSRQYEITPELDFLHGSTSHRGHPGPGLHFITLAPLLSAGSSSPLRQYSPSSSLLSSGQEYPHPSSSIGGISTARVKLCFPRSSCRVPHNPHSHSSKYSLPSIVFMDHQNQLTMQMHPIAALRFIQVSHIRLPIQQDRNSLPQDRHFLIATPPATLTMGRGFLPLVM